MVEFLLAPRNVVFVAALGIVLVLALLQLIGVGGDGEPDLDAGEIGAPAAFLGLDAVPLAIQLIVALLAFGGVGLVTEAATGLWRSPGIPVLSSFAGLVAALGAVRVSAAFFRRTRIAHETESVPSESLLGRTATITLGATSTGRPSQAKVTDTFGRTHYVLVEPEIAGDSFGAGETVTLVRREGAKFFVVGVGVEEIMRLDVTRNPSGGKAVSESDSSEQTNA